jgi:glutaminyl-peptide cyclotransferase
MPYLFAALALAFFQFMPSATGPAPTQYTYKVIRSYPHDRAAFTQGLEYRNGILWEGTGLNGRSSVRKVQLETGKVLQKVDIDSQHFGEGITLFGGQLFQLTWQSQTGFIYNAQDLKFIRKFAYRGEGWGLTSDSTRIFFSDGSDAIRVLDGKTLEERRRLMVRDAGRPVLNLNELEWVEGEIFANVWQTDRIARISPLDGRVLGWINLSGILPNAERSDDTDVLNGIAYDAARKRLFVTGKLWPKIYEIQLLPKLKP